MLLGKKIFSLSSHSPFDPVIPTTHYFSLDTEDPGFSSMILIYPKKIEKVIFVPEKN